MPTTGQSSTALLRRLTALSRQFGPEHVAEKLALLKALSRLSLKKSEELALYHDALCFIRAYPDRREIEQFAENELKRFGHRIAKHQRSSSDRSVAQLEDSGIVGTLTRHPFGYEIARHLKQQFGKQVTLDWDDNLSGWEDKLFDYLPMLVAWQENDSIDNDDDFDLEAFLRRARGRRGKDDLRGLLHLISGSILPAQVKRFFFESLDLEMKWDLTNSSGSRTLCRVPSNKSFYFHEPLKRRCADLGEEMRRASARLVRLTEKRGAAMIATACEVLAVRNRELYPVTLANPREIYKIEPGRGLQILLFATPPEIRLPLEANFGAMFFRNGIPVAYGIAATLFERVEIAINVFPAFRAGESAYIIEQFFKVFCHHFGSRVFLVRSMQMGNDEEEALHSGAFWFYYKLGFRAISPSVRKLAERERSKQLKNPGYRTPISTQKQLAKSDVVYFPDANSIKRWREPKLATLGYRVTDYFATKYDGDRDAGVTGAVRFVQRALGVKNTASWTRAEVVALGRLAPLLANISRLDRWNPRDKRAMVEIIRTKGSGLDRDYAQLCLSHSTFRDAIHQLAGV